MEKGLVSTLEKVKPDRKQGAVKNEGGINRTDIFKGIKVHVLGHGQMWKVKVFRPIENIKRTF